MGLLRDFPSWLGGADKSASRTRTPFPPTLLAAAGKSPAPPQARSQPSRGTTYDFRGDLGVKYRDTPFHLGRLRPGDQVKMNGATVTIGPDGRPLAVLNRGYDKGRTAAQTGPILVPQGPADADVQADIELARRRGWNPFWFRDQFTKGDRPWDYKNRGPHRQYEAYGNFNYGATGSATPMDWMPSDGLIYGEAGATQIRGGKSRREWGRPPLLGLPRTGDGNYGDDPVDQFWVGEGLRYGKAARP